MFKKNTDIQVATLEDAKHYIIVANKDSMDHQWLLFHGFKKLETPSYVKNAIKMLFLGRVDMIAFDNAVMQDEFHNAGYNIDETRKVIDLFKTPPYMALSLKTSDTILVRIQNRLNGSIKGKIFKNNRRVQQPDEIHGHLSYMTPLTHSSIFNSSSITCVSL